MTDSAARTLKCARGRAVRSCTPLARALGLPGLRERALVVRGMELVELHGAAGGHEGWAAVEEDLLEHDEGTMQGHASDVDTLLVFVRPIGPQLCGAKSSYRPVSSLHLMSLSSSRLTKTSKRITQILPTISSE